MSVVLPGEQVPAQHVNLKLGPGLLQTSHASNSKANTSIISTRAGTLNHSANRSRWWVESNSRRYVPAAQEPVIGVISQRQGEGYRVDVGSAHSANLDGLAFEGASKRNKPNLKVGCLVYSRVSLAHKDMEPELECFDAQTHKAEGFGELKGGFLVRCSMRMCRQLLDPSHFLLPLLGAMFPLEVAIGLNGRVWVNSKEAKQVIAVARAIEAADPDGGGLLDENEVKALLAGMDH
ncbi:exosome complex exonuclease rrp40 [Moniliophthora roreri MCA 2997]|uniref:Ribosomal RNA-processing protein 40 n=2 Tax=Moniliophthora roreri TaxID=221103 RepID=V2XPW4_MONRO|nr:exosome complex exonuclease rrp40 [Moniliophthora roreri MCA 2997]KAI3616225.1 exosome complex exonuclease rrp40 [Moniliophthora roreri]